MCPEVVECPWIKIMAHKGLKRGLFWARSVPIFLLEMGKWGTWVGRWERRVHPPNNSQIRSWEMPFLEQKLLLVSTYLNPPSWKSCGFLGWFLEPLQPSQRELLCSHKLGAAWIYCVTDGPKWVLRNKNIICVINRQRFGNISSKLFNKYSLKKKKKSQLFIEKGLFQYITTLRKIILQENVSFFF